MGKAVVTWFVLILVASLFVGLNFNVPTREHVVTNTVVDAKIINRTIETIVEIPLVDFVERNITVYGVGIYGNTSMGEAIPITMALRPGSGNVLLDVSDQVFDVNLQEGLSLVKTYAEGYTGVNIEHFDVVIRADAAAHEIGGSSGDSVMTVGLIALIQNKSVYNDTLITGALRSDGKILEVDSLQAKVNVAGWLGFNRILIPASQNVTNISYNIEIIPVTTIDDAVPIMVY